MWRIIIFLVTSLVFTTGMPSAAGADYTYFICPINCEEASDPAVEPESPIPDLTAAPVRAEEAPPAPPGEVTLIIDVRHRTLTVLNDGYPYHQFPCAVGKTETPSPVGKWSILRRARNWGTGFGTRWMGLDVTWGIYGIHGTNKPYSVGTRASHGCIRMFNRHAEALYPWVEAGTPVYIVGNIMGPEPRPVLVKGDRESGVLEIQRLMIKHGYYQGEIDGIFGGGLEQAIVNFRKDHGLVHDNRVDAGCYEILGL